MHLEGLENQMYIKKKKVGKEFFVMITDAGSHIACVSGLIDWEVGVVLNKFY